MDYYGNREFGFSSLRQFLDIVVMIAEFYAAAPLTVEWLLFHCADLIQTACDIWVQAGCYYKYYTYINLILVHVLHASSLIMWCLYTHQYNAVCIITNIAHISGIIIPAGVMHVHKYST